MIRSATVLLLLTLMVIGFLNLAERGVQAPSCEVFRVDCLIAKHQEFAAGIIGATGALFAAWIAWTTVQTQRLLDERCSSYITGEILPVIGGYLGG